MSASPKDRQSFIDRFVSETKDAEWSERVHVAKLLLRHSATHARLAEESCNGHPAQGMTYVTVEHINALQSQWDARIAKKERQIETRITSLCAPFGIVPNFGGDPRGYTVKLLFPSGIYNTWGGREAGYGVPQ